MADLSTRSNGAILTLEALAGAKRLPADYLCELGLADLPQGGVAIPYYGPTGEELAVKRRTALKAKEGSYWPRGRPLAAYGQWRLDLAAKAGFLIVVEGESDCWALWYHGLPALGLPGANTVKTLLPEHVEAVNKVYIHREPDAGGATFLKAVADRLAAVGFHGKIFELRMPDVIKDPSDLHVCSPENFLETFRATIEASRPIVPEQQRARVTTAPTSPRKPAQKLEPYQPFPVDALPVPVNHYVREGAIALGCDPAFVALPALAVLASAIGNTRTIRLKRGWEEPSVVWSVVVADSGTLKSPAWLKAVDYQFKCQRQKLHDFRQQVATYKQDIAQHQKDKRRAERGKAILASEPEQPKLKRVVCSDTTIEKLVEILEENPRGLLVTRDELSGWLGSFTRYKGRGGGTDLPHWLEMFRAGAVVVDRKTGDRQTLFVGHSAVSVTGGIQPGTLARALSADFLEAGLGARLLMAMPTKVPKKWSEIEISPEAEKAYQDTIDRLLALDFHRDSQGEEVPFGLRLTPEAKAAWVNFYDEWALMQAASEGEMAAAYSKLEAYAARFALIHHVTSLAYLQEDDCNPVDEISIRAGISLCHWFAGEARRIYAALAESDEQRERRRLLEWIRTRGGTVTAKELQRSNSRKFPSAGIATLALDGLVQDGYGQWQDRPTDAKGGRPTRDFVIASDDTDETDDTPRGRG